MTYFNFIDLTTQVRIEYGNGLTVIQYFLYPKNTLAVSVLGNVLTVSETESAQLVVRVDYSTDTVLAPTSIDINDLATQLATMFGSAGGGGGGDASAANQVIQIGLETDILDNQTNGTQKTQVVGDTGTSLLVETDGSINVNTTITGVATETTLQDVATTLSNIEGNQTSGAQVTQIVNPEGDYLLVNTDGSLTTTPISFDFRVSKGDFIGAENFLISSFATLGTIQQPIANWITAAGLPYGLTLTTNKTLTIVSTSGNDTLIGTGLRAVMVRGLVDNAGVWTDTMEIVNLNGTTPVTTVNQYIRINQFIGVAAGSIGRAIGTITLYDTVVTDIMRQIPAGESEDFGSMFSTPSNKSLYLTSITASNASNDSTLFAFKLRTDGLPIFSMGKQRVNQALVTVPIKYYRVVPKTDIWLEARASFSTDTVYCDVLGFTY